MIKEFARKLKVDTDSKFKILKKIVRYLNAGLNDQASFEIHNFPDLDPSQNPRDLKYYLFLKALSKRVMGTGMPSKNLYLQNFEANQIDLFNFMGRKMPLVYLSSRIANDLIYEKLKLRQEQVFINIGIGTGRQEKSLLEHLARHPTGLKRLHIVGIEPSSESLLQAHDAIMNAGQSSNIELTFTPINACIEDLDREQWNQIESIGAAPILNAAFALHHSRHKERVIQRVRQLEPSLFILSEPHSDHETSRLSQRFLNAWSHYGLAFDVIDQLNLEEEEKRALKVFFFSREIEDVLGNQDQSRTERHETAGQWMRRLTDGGFTASKLPSTIPMPHSHPLISITHDLGMVHLGLEQQPIVSIIAVEAVESKTHQ